MLLVSSCVPAVVTWLCNRVMWLQSRPTNWPFLTIESPVAQWLENPRRSRRVVDSNPIWDSDFSEFSLHLISLVAFKKLFGHSRLEVAKKINNSFYFYYWFCFLLCNLK